MRRPVPGVRDVAWFRAAACSAESPEMFFPSDAPDPRVTARAMDAAKSVCGRCPVRFACLTDALGWETAGERHGVVGGLTPDERDDLTRHHRAPSRAARPAARAADERQGRLDFGEVA